MKLILLSFLTATNMISFAHASSALTQNCLGEAQIIATIAFNEPASSGKCRATVQANVRFFAASQVCPLSLNDVVSKGVLIPADNFQCLLQPGDEINGIIALDAAGNISLTNK